MLYPLESAAVSFHRRILIDTGSKGYPDYIANLQKVLEEHNASIQEIILTHRHHDHIGGAAEICSEIYQGCTKMQESTILHSMHML